MRVMLDTNILVSAAFFPNERMEQIIDFIDSKHELVLSDLITCELLEVAAYEKFNKVSEAKAYLKGLSYIEFITPKIEPLENLHIRDDGDYPILFSAIKSAVDIFLTGDKDFLESGISTLKIMTITEFESKFMRR